MHSSQPSPSAIPAKKPAEAKAASPLLEQLKKILLLLSQNANKKALSKAAAPLRCDRPQLVESLKLLAASYKPAELVPLIEFFQRPPQNIVKTGNLPALYLGLRAVYQAANKCEDARFFQELYAAQKGLSLGQQHSATLELALMHGVLGDQEKMKQCFTKVQTLEKDLSSAFIKKDGLIARLLENFEGGLTKHLALKKVTYFSLQFCLEKAVEFSPQDPRVLQTISASLAKITKAPIEKLSIGLIKLGVKMAQYFPETEKQIPELTALFSKGSARPDMIIQQANVHLLAGEYKQSIACAQSVLKQDATNIQALFVVGKAYAEQKEYAAALVSLEAVFLREDAPLAVRYQASAYLGNAYTYLEKIDKALFYIEQALEMDPYNASNPTLFCCGISLYSSLDETRMAKKLFATGKSRFPADKGIKAVGVLFFKKIPPTLDEKESPENLAYEVALHANQNEFEAAQLKVNFLLKKYPDNPIANHGIGSFYLKQGKYPEALKCFNFEKSRTPIPSRFLIRKLMETHLCLKQFKEAQQEAQQLLKQERGALAQYKLFWMRAYQVLMVTGVQLENYQEVAALLNQALTQKDIDLEEQMDLHCHLAKVYSLQREYKMAEQHAERVIALAPLTAPAKAYSILGTIHYRQQNFELARKNWEKCLALKPDQAEILYLCGLTYYFSDLSQALPYFSKLLAIDPSYHCRLVLVLPPEFLEQLDKMTAATEKTSQPEVKAEAKEDSPVLPKADESATVEKPSVTLAPALIPYSPPKPKPKEEKRLTHEQLINQMMRDDKKRRALEIEAKLRAKEEEKLGEGWDVPGVGFIPITDPRLVKLAFKGYPSEKSHLYAFLDINKIDFSLQKEQCDDREGLINKWKETHALGRIVSKENEQGYVQMDEAESAKLTPGEGPVYTMKLKRLGLFGDPRAYGRELVSREGNNTLVWVNKAKMNTH